VVVTVAGLVVTVVNSVNPANLPTGVRPLRVLPVLKLAYIICRRIAICFCSFLLFVCVCVCVCESLLNQIMAAQPVKTK